MENAIKARLQSLRLGDPQVYKGIAIVPLIAVVDGRFQYLTLGEALAAPANFAIMEVSTSGSVPDLMVVNRGDTPVLLVDGEELAGAKQNRVLNSSILIKERSETKIPVSCTEQGRWSYNSASFADSGHIMAHESRSKKSSSVRAMLETCGMHCSDQAEVWRGIAELQDKAGTHSPTSAMHDVFVARENDLKQCDEVFRSVPNQVGLLTFIRGEPAGADIVSLASAYARLHPKLVRSYALEGILEAKQETRSPKEILKESRRFLQEIMAAEVQQFPSIGHGTDHRYKGKNLAGSVLVHGDEVIHAAFFHVDETGRANYMASLRQRRRAHSS